MKGTSYIFVDRQLYNVPQLLAHVKPDSRVVLLEGDRDGIEQISQVLQKQQSIREIHLVSHGSPDCLYLGNSRLSLETLPRYAALLGQWREAIAQGANILLYGCRVAAEGLGLMNALHTLTGASIAAASQPVGKGNWQLDRQIGAIAASLAFSPELQQRYTGTFGTGYALSNNTLIAFDTSNPSNPAPKWAAVWTDQQWRRRHPALCHQPQNGRCHTAHRCPRAVQRWLHQPADRRHQFWV
jgi:hypothetical protein